MESVEIVVVFTPDKFLYFFTYSKALQKLIVLIGLVDVAFGAVFSTDNNR